MTSLETTGARAARSEAERLLGQIINDADIVAEGDHPDLWRGKTIFLLVSISPEDFGRLCEYGSELEDLEDTNDAERDLQGFGNPCPGWWR